MPARYRRALVLVRLHGVPIGVAELDRRDASGWDGVAARAAEALGDAVDGHLRADGLRAGSWREALDTPPRCRQERADLLRRAPPASVIVATRDGEATLGPCLDSLLAMEYPRFEVIVVDNASRGDGVPRVVAERAAAGHPVSLVHEPRPGLAVAHNRGLREAGGEIAAFTDDDVVVDPLWLAQIARGFEAAPRVGCVTGAILPFELESPAQVLTEACWGLMKGFDARVFDERPPPGHPLHPYTAGLFGSGANMAFGTALLRELGGFDDLLGAGSPGRGGDDLAAFFDVIVSGHRLVFEPTAVVHHRYRSDPGSLERQARGYGHGLGAYLARIVLRHPRRLGAVARLAPRAVRHVADPSSPRNARRPPALPANLARLERRAIAAGAVAYAANAGRERVRGGGSL